MNLKTLKNKYISLSQDQYTSLNDAEVISPDLAEGKTNIWYAISTRDLGMGFKWCQQHDCLPDTENLEKTHVLLGSVKGTDKDKLFGLMQGEIWSPNGEARQFIKNSGVWHTSMSIGDIIEIGNKFFMVDRAGFKELT